MELTISPVAASVAVLFACLVDAVAGGRHLLGRVAGPDQLLGAVLRPLVGRLDRAKRGGATLAVRGGLLVVVLAAPLALAGHALDRRAADGGWAVVVAVALLILLIGQRQSFDTARRDALMATEQDGPDGDHHAATRAAIERLTQRFADGLVANLFWFLTTGLAGLLAFRLLSATVSAGAPSGLVPPASRFFALPSVLYRLAAAVPALLAGIVLLLAGWFVPGARPRLGAVPAAWASRGIQLRATPLAVLAYGLGLAFLVRRQADGEPVWLGPDGARARAGAADARRALVWVFAAWLIVLAGIAGLALAELTGQVRLPALG